MKLRIWNRALASVTLLTMFLILTTSNATHASITLACNSYKIETTSFSREYSDGIENLSAGAPIEALIVFMEFQNRRAIQADRNKLLRVSAKVSDFYYQMSENSIHINWHLHQESLNVGRNSVEYQANSREEMGAIEIIVDIQKMIQQIMDISMWDFILVITPSSTLSSEVSKSVAFLDRGQGLINSALLASDFWKAANSWQIVAHEIGHAFGLLDLYSLEAAKQIIDRKATYFDQFKFMKSYDLMNKPNTSAPGFVMWNRLQLVPSLSHRLDCFRKGVNFYGLVSINSTKSGYKGILVPLSDSRILMIEVRDNLGVDSNIGYYDLGVITYVVDLGVESGMGPLRIDCSKPLNSNFSNCGLKTGQSRLIEKLRITLVSSSKLIFLISVVRIP